MILLDCVLPGAGLVLRGRLWLGSIVLLLAIISASALVIISIISPDNMLEESFWPLLAVYMGLMVLTVLMQLLINRKSHYDQQLVRRLHMDCAQQFLNGSPEQALQLARQLCSACSTLLGPWQLLALIADGQGERSLASKARRKIEEITAAE
ncbi:MAG: hypothetical protein HRU15_18275 [Planctomycetes bacterium]|nr:hypothetical protein [Planctomycetota bacterium]